MSTRDNEREYKRFMLQGIIYKKRGCCSHPLKLFGKVLQHY